MARARSKPPTRGSAAPGSAAFVAAGAAALLLTGWVCATAPALSLPNLHGVIAQGRLLHDVLAGHGGSNALKPWPVPDTLCQILLGLLMFAAAPLTAGKLLLIATLLGFGVLGWALCRKVGVMDRAAFAILVCVVGLGVPFWAGQLGFQLGMLLLMGHLLLVRDGGMPRWWQEALIALLTFFAHPLALGMLAVHLGWRAYRQRGLVRGTLRVLAVMLPALILIAWYSRSDHGYGAYAPADPGVGHYLLTRAKALAGTGPFQPMLLGAAGGRHGYVWLGWLGLAVNVLFAATLFPALLGAAAAAQRAGRGFAEVMTALTGFVAFLLLPDTMFGLAGVAALFLPPAVLFALAGAPDWRGLRRIAAWIACLMPVMALFIGFVAPDAGRATAPAIASLVYRR